MKLDYSFANAYAARSTETTISTTLFAALCTLLEALLTVRAMTRSYSDGSERRALGKPGNEALDEVFRRVADDPEVYPHA